jgi:acyl-CoA thioesterase FadM
LHNVTPTYTDTVRFSDTDQMGHVNNSRFLVFLEDARLVFFNALMPGGFTGRGLIVARIEIDYVRPMVTSGWTASGTARSPSATGSARAAS